MPVKILKIFHGTNIMRARLASGREVWGYRWTHNGKKYTRAKWETRKDAEDALYRLKLRIRDSKDPDLQNSKLTLGVLLDTFIEYKRVRGANKNRLKSIETILNRFMKVTASQKLCELTTADLLAYQSIRLEKKIHHHSINKEMVIIGSVMRSAKLFFPTFEWTPPKIEGLPRLHDGREVILERDELRKLIADLSESQDNITKTDRRRRALAADVVAVGAETAMRISEILNLEKSQVRFDRAMGYDFGYLVVKNAKSRKLKTIPMTAEIAAIIKRHIETRRGRFVFRDEGSHMRSSCNDVRRAMKAACERLGIRYGLNTGGVVFHTIRHSAVTHLINEGIPQTTVMAITGHSSRVMLNRYSHATPATIKQAIQQLSLSEGEPERKEQTD